MGEIHRPTNKEIRFSRTFKNTAIISRTTQMFKFKNIREHLGIHMKPAAITSQMSVKVACVAPIRRLPSRNLFLKTRRSFPR